MLFIVWAFIKERVNQFMSGREFEASDMKDYISGGRAAAVPVISRVPLYHDVS